MPRNQGGRGLLSVKVFVELERSSQFHYAINSNARLLNVANEQLQRKTKIDWKKRKDKRKTFSIERLRATEKMQD